MVKLGPNRSIAQERVAFEQVEDVLGNNALRVRGFVDLADRAGLKYSYAAMGQGGVRTLQSMFAADIPTPQLASLVQTAFDEILGPLYAAARYERLPLFSHYEFSADKAPRVRAALALVPDATRTMLEFPGGLELPNVCGFYDEFLTRTPLPTQDYHYVSYVHGDLNAANILVDAHDNVWVIDFFHAGRGHVLKDLAKFENDLLYLLTPIDDDAQLQEAISITLALREVADLGAPLADLPDGVRSPHLVRAWEIRVLGGARSARSVTTIATVAVPGGRPALRRSHARLPEPSRCRSSRRSSPRARLPTRSLAPSRPTWCCGSTGSNPRTSGPAGSG